MLSTTRKEIITACASILFLALSILAVLSYSKSGRVFVHQTAAKIITTPQDAIAVWESAGVRGRILFLFDRYLNADPGHDPTGSIPPVSQDNYLYVAFRKNIVRRVYHIIPDRAWQEVQHNLGRGWNVSPENQAPIHITIDGTPITIMRISDIHRTSEKVLVNINGSCWLPEELRTIASLFRQGIIEPDILTVAGNVPPDFLQTITRL